MKFSSPLRTMITAGSVLLSTTVYAATITTGATWPAAPDAETVDVHSLTAQNGRGVTADRQIRQTLQTASDIDLGTIILSFDGYTGNAFTIKFFEVADVEANSWSAGTQVGGTITVASGTAASGNTNLAITLTALEQFTLAARNTGDQGYGIEIESVGTASIGGWRHAFDGTDHATGRYYDENGTGKDLDRDMGVALVNVPEPSSIALLGLGTLCVLRRRR